MTRRKKTKACRWFAGSTKAGYEVACLVDSKGKGARPKGTPKRWRIAFGPYKTKKKAFQVAQYQSHGDTPKVLKRPRR